MLKSFAGLATMVGILTALPGRAQACIPGCSGYHLIFTAPVGVAAVASDSLEVTWQDAIDGPAASFDLLASVEPVRVYAMHSFPAELPGEVLALGLSASSETSWTWTTATVAEGTYYLYAVFHNPPFDTLVLPFAVVTVAHGATIPAPMVLIGSPRGVSSAEGAVRIQFDAQGPDAVVDLYAGRDPGGADGVLIASGLPALPGQAFDWQPGVAESGSRVFKAVLRGNGGSLATALSPGSVEVGSAPSGCATAGGPLSALALLAASALLRRKREAPRSR